MLVFSFKYKDFDFATWLQVKLKILVFASLQIQACKLNQEIGKNEMKEKENGSTGA